MKAVFVVDNLTDDLCIKLIRKAEANKMNYTTEIPESSPVMEKADPWKHRSKGMVCETCMWFIGKGDDPKFGRCRRHAPTLNGYPAVFNSDWCGDHKLDETKIR